jgi:hypothetical protein
VIKIDIFEIGVIVVQRSRFTICLVLLCAGFLFKTTMLAAQQSQAGQGQKTAAIEKPSHPQLPDMSGDWQVSWQGRLGSDEGTLHAHQEGTKLTGTFHDVHGISSLSGTITAKQISFDVQFQGLRPFTTRFTGSEDEGKIEGTSQAVGVGGSGAYLGHAGEIVQPEHPWTATRLASPPAHPDETGSNPTPPVRK